MRLYKNNFMERNTETKTLSFSQGVTNVLRDLLCEKLKFLQI